MIKRIEHLARKLLEGVLAVRDENREYQENLEGSDRADVTLNELPIFIGDAIEKSDLSDEDVAHEELGEAQELLRSKGLIILSGEASNSGIYSKMEFPGELVVERARSYLKED